MAEQGGVRRVADFQHYAIHAEFDRMWIVKVHAGHLRFCRYTRFRIRIRTYVNLDNILAGCQVQGTCAAFFRDGAGFPAEPGYCVVERADADAVLFTPSGIGYPALSAFLDNAEPVAVRTAGTVLGIWKFLLIVMIVNFYRLLTVTGSKWIKNDSLPL